MVAQFAIGNRQISQGDKGIRVLLAQYAALEGKGRFLQFQCFPVVAQLTVYKRLTVKLTVPVAPLFQSFTLR